VISFIVGIVGAALANWLLSPLVGVPSISQNAFTIGALLVSLAGAIELLGIINLTHRGTPRYLIRRPAS